MTNAFNTIKSCKKYLLSYKDSSNNTHQLGFYARDTYDCLMLARDLKNLNDNPSSVLIAKKSFEITNHDSKKSPFSIQDKNLRDLDNAIDYPTIADLKKSRRDFF